jgi:hypothetical protein
MEITTKIDFRKPCRYFAATERNAHDANPEVLFRHPAQKMGGRHAGRVAGLANSML